MFAHNKALYIAIAFLVSANKQVHYPTVLIISLSSEGAGVASMSKDEEDKDNSSGTGRAVWLVTIITPLPLYREKNRYKTQGHF